MDRFLGKFEHAHAAAKAGAGVRRTAAGTPLFECHRRAGAGEALAQLGLAGEDVARPLHQTIGVEQQDVAGLEVHFGLAELELVSPSWMLRRATVQYSASWARFALLSSCRRSPADPGPRQRLHAACSGRGRWWRPPRRPCR